MEFNHFVLIAANVPNAGVGLKRLDYRIKSWDVDFHNYIKYVEETKNKPVILAGDFNVAHTENDVYKAKDKIPGYTLEER
jgi:exonuclease III